MAGDANDLERVLNLISERTGLDCTLQLRAAVQIGITRGMQRTDIADESHYYALLKCDAREFEELIADVTVGETYFFREPLQFEFLRQTVLPELSQPMGRRAFHVWSAGCATGEEAYTLAMVLAEEGCEQSRILATDISRAVLAKAKEGSYREWSLRGPAADLARRWLIRAEDRYQVREELQRAVTFSYLNLASDEYPSASNGTSNSDLIFCRNVLIYFNRETILHVARRLYDSLAPGGWLVTSASDPPLVEMVPWQTITTEAGLVYRRPGNEAQPLQLTEHQPPAIAADEPVESVATPPPAPTPTKDVSTTIAEVHTLAACNPAAAINDCREALLRHPLSAELHYLQAVLWQAQDCSAEAETAARRAIYLDRSLAVAHFLLGVILQQRGDTEAAGRAYRNASQLCEAQPAENAVPLSEGETAGGLAAAARANLEMLAEKKERSS